MGPVADLVNTTGSGARQVASAQQEPDQRGGYQADELNDRTTGGGFAPRAGRSVANAALFPLRWRRGVG